MSEDQHRIARAIRRSTARARNNMTQDDPVERSKITLSALAATSALTDARIRNLTIRYVLNIVNEGKTSLADIVSSRLSESNK